MDKMSTNSFYRKFLQTMNITIEEQPNDYSP
nr:MAG TPA: hypothetical protein [Bacteriophage sp.]